MFFIIIMTLVRQKLHVRKLAVLSRIIVEFIVQEGKKKLYADHKNLLINSTNLPDVTCLTCNCFYLTETRT